MKVVLIDKERIIIIISVTGFPRSWRIMENHGKWKNKIQAWKSHGKWKFGKKSWKSHGIVNFYKCLAHFVWEKGFDYLQFWHTMSHLYLWKILHTKSKKLDSAAPGSALDRIAVAVEAVKSVLNVFFRPQPKFWRMPIVVIRRVRPSVRQFEHYNLFRVSGMHSKLHIQGNHD